tara:strand:+ start:9363 stop:10229 length:867 start_codon:yes stop_codon:yes gene_type:complete
LKAWSSSLLVILIISVVAGCASPSYRAPVKKQKHVGPNPAHHQVEKGDTLYSIAWRYNLDFRELASLNRIAKPYTIYPNQLIKLQRTKRTQLANKQPKNPPLKNNIGQIQNSNRVVIDRPKKPQVQDKPLVKPKPVKASTKPAQKQDTTEKTVVKKVLKNPTKKSVTKWVWPVKGRVLSGYSSSNANRKGIDIGGNIGSLVRAAADGKVVYSGSGLRGYGNLIIIKHDDDFLSAYAHNRQLLAKENDSVKAGQVIAELGSTEAKRPMLHFEIRRKGKPVNPLKYLPRR